MFYQLNALSLMPLPES